MWNRLVAIEERFEELTAEMGRPEVAADFERLQSLARERAALEEIVSLYRSYREVDRALGDARAIVAEGGDPEMVALAKEEVATLAERFEGLDEQLKRALLPKDPHDERDVIVEIRAGTGGEEAALFAADLYRMYSRYADRHGWRTGVVSVNETGIGGLKEIIFEVQGRGAYSRLKYESGVHRVQRVPQTEAQGRIHTSAATVAVLPEAEEVEVEIKDDDLRVDIFHASSHGGQNVQKVATAVRITHLPTGLVASCQDERSQLKNRQKAMAVLRARLLALKEREQEAEISAARRAQVGTGERSEKIRTYNFPQDRVTDHRVSLTLHKLPAVLDGELDEFIDAVATSEQTRQLEQRAAV
ncbi:MAG: peptide chain release factor 1 [Chloroflexi bacterium RBG_16_68_14]|nr:MAG: peptide chain release factor 1 [Chloroflexi bacterium RBG_16_68_14]